MGAPGGALGRLLDEAVSATRRCFRRVIRSRCRSPTHRMADYGLASYDASRGKRCPRHRRRLCAPAFVDAHSLHRSLTAGILPPQAATLR
jgi:hypothetical protein